jgi:hypothetical protein
MNQRRFTPLTLAAVAVGAIMLTALILIAITTVSHQGKLPVRVYLLPQDAKLTVDGSPISAGTAYLAPGSHVTVIGRDGYTTQTVSVFFSASQAVRSIDIALAPVSPDAKAWVDAHKDLYTAREARGGTNSRVFGQNFQANNPIVKQLPFSNYLFTIGYVIDQSDPTGQSIIIKIDADPGYRNGAIDQIRAFGFDPTDFNIQFNNYKDPFLS